ncbi:GNAT family N-acetyltransferase [Oceanirhabdus sp. W0125-5]|uniref:GNAT family N-acetyltransferase n=1 Tax=Oceanirhabdus sp. W0125-5 TaxID=2999116 RepID=UPI0022F3412B|nr:GNAT family N-acetyltransferase [Oceanirhabdus sp. W0125-5]WBW96679.1 GNAT family N-acetyltransferase [Oceanirhabdus sp. W0125-5]
MYKLNEKNFDRVKELVKDYSIELSIFSVIEGNMPGEIYVDNEDMPSSVLIKTPECTLLAGNADNSDFNEGIKNILDFWDQVTFASEKWEEKIEEFHKNKFIRKYKRRHYILNKFKYSDYRNRLEEGFYLEKVDPYEISKSNLENSEDVIEWVNNWGSFDNFIENGAGFIVRNDKTIVSWSLTDCLYNKKVEIGINTDEDYRKRGFGAIAAAATADYCLSNGIEEIGWHCVDTNIGSICIAEKLGFQRAQDYYSFTPYPPIENESDLDEEQWTEWALYYEDAIKTEPELMMVCAFCWARANNVDETIKIININKETGWKSEVQRLANHPIFLRFKDNLKWNEFLNYLIKEWE